MEEKMCGIGGVCFKFKPHLLMTLAQLSYSIVNFITEASFESGFNPYFYITYRSIVAGLGLLPFAFFIERKRRPTTTLALFLEIFVLSVLGPSEGAGERSIEESVSPIAKPIKAQVKRSNRTRKSSWKLREIEEGAAM